MSIGEFKFIDLKINRGIKRNSCRVHSKVNLIITSKNKVLIKIMTYGIIDKHNG